MFSGSIIKVFVCLFQSLERSSFSSSNETKTINNENHFEDAFFDDWSLNQSSNSSNYLQSKTSVDIRSTNRTYQDEDDDDQLDFEPDENLLPMDDDEGESDKVTWISNDVHDDGPEYRDREFPFTKRMFERFHALFGLRKFRSNQQEAVSCAVERKYHVFVLMPTGSSRKFLLNEKKTRRPLFRRWKIVVLSITSCS